MDAFSYLSVLLSIILGLAITQVLQGVRGLLLARAAVRTYWPTIVWAAMILIFATQSWWASFGLATHRDWTFVGFGMLLLQTVLLYMLAALVLPDFEPGRPTDLNAHYYREAGPFFSVMIAMLAASVLKDVAIDGHLPDWRNLAFHAAFGTLAIVLAVSRHRRVHEVSAVLIVALIAAYIGLFFERLR